MNELVSIIMPVYNREKTIRRAVDSVLKQTYANFELIIVDDGSADDSVKIVEQYSDSRIKLIRLESNQGANAARNIGIKNASGEYIAFQDSDDEWYHNKLEMQMAKFKTKCDAVFCPYILVDGTSRKMYGFEYDNSYSMNDQLKETLKKYNVIGTPTLILKKKTLEDVGLFDETLPRLQDYELVLRIIKKYTFGYVPEVLVNAYREGKAISTNDDSYIEAYESIIKKHFGFLNIEAVIYGLCELYYGKKEYFNRINNIKYKVEREQQQQIDQIIISFLLERLNFNISINKKYFMSIREEIKNREFIIYGCGEYGKRFYSEMAEDGIHPYCFAESYVQDDNRQYENIPIKSIDAIDNKSMLIIVAVAEKLQKELVRNLEKKGFSNFCIYVMQE